MTSRRLLSVRVTLLAVALAAGAYAAALPVYLFFRVSRPALALGAATEAITTVSAVFARRDSALNRAVAIVRDLARRPRPSADSLRLVAASRFGVRGAEGWARRARRQRGLRVPG